MPQPTVGGWAERHDEEEEYPLDVNAWRGKIAPHLNQRVRAAYFAFLAYLDSQIGRLTDRYLPENENTFILMTSDHGEMLGDHNLWRKSYAYEPSARVPFIVRPPASWEVKRNVEIDRLVGWEDIMPTLLDVAGAPIPETVEGRSIVPLLRGEDRGWREVYHGEHSACYHPDNANQFLTDRRWKYIWNSSTGEEQLFDLLEDPNECNDLAQDIAHREALESWRNRMIEELAGRQEGFSDGTKLSPKLTHAWHGSQGPVDIHLG